MKHLYLVVFSAFNTTSLYYEYSLPYVFVANELDNKSDELQQMIIERFPRDKYVMHNFSGIQLDDDFTDSLIKEYMESRGNDDK